MTELTSSNHETTTIDFSLRLASILKYQVRGNDG
jgi:hypothetical protein